MVKQKHLKIISARYVYCDWMFSHVVGEVEIEDEKGKRYFFTDDEFDGMPTFLKTKTSVLDTLFEEKNDDEEKIQTILSKPYIQSNDYWEILDKKSSPNYQLFRYIIYLVTESVENADKFIKNTVGKYIDEIEIPKSETEIEKEEDEEI